MIRNLLAALERIAKALERGNVEVAELRRQVRDTGTQLADATRAAGRQVSLAVEEAAIRLGATPGGGSRD